MNYILLRYFISLAKVLSVIFGESEWFRTAKHLLSRDNCILSPSNKSQLKAVAQLEISVRVFTLCSSFVFLFHFFIQCSPFNVCALQERILFESHLAI